MQLRSEDPWAPSGQGERNLISTQRISIPIETNDSPCRLVGFLLGSTLAGAGTYYYILEEYKVSNELLTEDIYVSRDSVDDLYERVAI